MDGSPHFSVTTAAALVLGGVAAMVLATLIALGERGNSASASGKSSANDATTGAARMASSAEREYLLDVSDATDPSELVP